MENPIFKLEGVVKSKGEMQDFVGPLVLILQLLSKNKIEIKDISISLILEQYIAHLSSLASMDLEIASEFVAMASYLVYIKTKMLLSDDNAAEELNELINSLEELRRRDSYFQIKSVTGTLAELYRNNYGLIVKPPEYLTPDHSYKFEHQLSDLITAFCQLVDRDEQSGLAVMKPTSYPKPIAYSVTEKAGEIMDQIKARGALQISDLMLDTCSRSEMVAVFIAVLELCKSGVIYLIGCDDELTLCCSGPDVELPVFDEMLN